MKLNPFLPVSNRAFENVAKFRELGTTVTNQNLIHNEIKSTMNSNNACYHSVRNILYSRLVSKDVKSKIYKTTIVLVVLCKTCVSSLDSDIMGRTQIGCV
jgi:hypothetical protein